MRECVETARYKAKLRSDVEEGARLGLASTPSFWINGKLLPMPSREGLVKVFEAILKQRGVVLPSAQDLRKVGE
jgi:protein-disulfide isomerase